MSTSSENIDFAVHYPFTSAAKELIGKEGIAINERILELAVERIKTALQEGKTAKSAAVHYSEKIEDLASYAAAKMLLAYMKNRYLINKFAVGEAKRANAYLSAEDEESIERMGKEFGITAEKQGNGYLIPVYIYLKFSPRSVDYLLVNRRLKDGNVFVNRNERIRLMEEAIRKHVEKTPLIGNAQEEVRKAAQRLIELLPKITPVSAKAINLDFATLAHPPCVEKLIDSLKKHENLPHQARWYLAVYLLAMNVEMEEIVSLYSNLPDYNEKITRYQLEHAKKRGYSVPTCATVLSYGLCCAVCKINNPMNWHRLKKSDKEEIKNTGTRKA